MFEVDCKSGLRGFMPNKRSIGRAVRLLRELYRIFVASHIAFIDISQELYFTGVFPLLVSFLELSCPLDLIEFVEIGV